MAQDRDVSNASQGTQLRRPSLKHRESGSCSDVAQSPGAPAPRLKAHPQKQHHVGRLHTRAPSSKAVHKLAGHGNAHAHAHPHTHIPATARHSRRQSSTADSEHPPPSSHRRTASEVKLSSRVSAPNLTTHPQAPFKRHRSHVEVNKRTRSTDKLKRSSSGAAVSKLKSAKAQVHFDLGSDDPEGEWVDASTTNSPFLSRKGSINSSPRSSSRPDASAASSRPETPNEGPRDSGPSSPDRERSFRQEYLTSRLLRRTASHGAPPMMTTDFARATPTQVSSSSISADRNASPLVSESQEEITSRFIDGQGSERARVSSGLHLPTAARTPNDAHRRAISTSQIDAPPSETPLMIPDDMDDSALVPKPSRRTAATPAENSRIQQKLNLQRASSSLEPGQVMTGPRDSHDGSLHRDLRIGKLLERTGTEYLVVRRYQNPIVRSIDRLSKDLGADQARTQQTSLKNAPSANGRRSQSSTGRHERNAGMSDNRQPYQSAPPGSTSTTGAVSHLEANSGPHGNSKLSGASSGGTDDEEDTTGSLRRIWDKSMDLSVSCE